MLASKVASLATWGDLALELALPRSATHTATALTRTLRRQSLWPTVIAEVDSFVERLQNAPPPIDYRVRRVVGDDILLLAAALRRAGAPTAEAPSFDVLRRFWEVFTGGDIAFAPRPIAIENDQSRYVRYASTRSQIDDDQGPRFVTAHGYLCRLRHIAVGGPLHWVPP